MAHRYRITVLPLDPEHPCVDAPLEFETANHDDLFAVLTKMRAKGIVPDDEVASLTIGLKLFSESLLRHRNDAPFDMLWPQMAAFMKALKALPEQPQRG